MVDFYTENLFALQERGFLLKLGIFPANRGFVDGVLKGCGGLSVVVLTEIYNILLRNSSSKYLLFLALWSCMSTIGDDPAEPYHFPLAAPSKMTLFLRNGTKLEQQVGTYEFLIQGKDESVASLLASSSVGALGSFNDQDDFPKTNLVDASLSSLVVCVIRFPMIGTTHLFFNGAARPPSTHTFRSPSPTEGDVPAKGTSTLKLGVSCEALALKKVILLSLGNISECQRSIGRMYLGFSLGPKEKKEEKKTQRHRSALISSTERHIRAVTLSSSTIRGKPLSGEIDRRKVARLEGNRSAVKLGAERLSARLGLNFSPVRPSEYSFGKQRIPELFKNKKWIVNKLKEEGVVEIKRSYSKAIRRVDRRRLMSWHLLRDAKFYVSTEGYRHLLMSAKQVWVRLVTLNKRYLRGNPTTLGLLKAQRFWGSALLKLLFEARSSVAQLGGTTERSVLTLSGLLQFCVDA
ncbi:hypothetical protein V8G54_020606 [Vigna mungo]|uniref:Nodulin-like domain-containing protein n=1 Tax=Vigna mungo TaxID=3915 RepID=A0AAQ3NBY0_VIGMU